MDTIVSSVSTSNLLPQISHANAQTVAGITSTGSALQSDNLSAAQSALNALQENVTPGSPSSTSQPFGSNSQANKDYQAMTTALQSGDLAAAQSAFASLQADLHSAPENPQFHHFQTSDVVKPPIIGSGSAAYSATLKSENALKLNVSA